MAKKLIVALAVEGKSTEYVKSVINRYKNDFHCGENLFVYINNIENIKHIDFKDEIFKDLKFQTHLASELGLDRIKLGLIKINTLLNLDDVLKMEKNEDYDRFILCDADDELDYDKAASIDVGDFDMVKGNILIKDAPDKPAYVAEYAQCHNFEIDMDSIIKTPNNVNEVIDLLKEDNRSKILVQMPVVITKLKIVSELNDYIVKYKVDVTKLFNINYADDFIVQTSLLINSDKIKFIEDSWYTYVKTEGSRTDRTGKTRDELRWDGISFVRDYLTAYYNLKKLFGYTEKDPAVFEALTLMKIVDIEPALKCRI